MRSGCTRSAGFKKGRESVAVTSFPRCKLVQIRFHGTVDWIRSTLESTTNEPTGFAMHQANKESERDNFSYYDAHCPEGKIELTDGQLIVGNSPAGTLLLFDHILRGWSLDAATAFG